MTDLMAHDDPIARPTDLALHQLQVSPTHSTSYHLQQHLWGGKTQISEISTVRFQYIIKIYLDKKLN